MVCRGELQAENPSETRRRALSRSPHFHPRPVRGIKLCWAERRLKKGKAGEGNGQQG